ncbi:dna polymerase subunit alpha b [Ophiostoma piceae UAMH 11346]|uniref:DNA polymerase alpha subunit B n=1 Tax=Ophiostoma piceae (strain UAMH 11346) TaxID=1262450 RepID=S3CX25_OPHP1|nr:dna polymerase subunit alpha b [Ophiostoma piceae UAMH 11346]
MMADVAKLNERFAAGDDQLEPDIVYQLQSIMNMHGLPVQELFYKWEAYCIKFDVQESVQSALTIERLRAFKQDLQDSLERRNQEQKQASANVIGGLHVSGGHKKIKTEPRSSLGGGGGTPRNAGKADVFGLLGGIMPSTPSGRKVIGGGSAKKNGSVSVKPETPSMSRVRGIQPGSSPVSSQVSHVSDGAPATPFSDRANAGDVIEALNDHLPAYEPLIAVPYATPRIKVTTSSDQKKLIYKPMAMKLSEASATLDERIEDFADIVMQHYKEKYGETAFGSAATWDTAEIIAVGRIASDAVSSSTGTGAKQLNAASIVFETSRRMGGGLRVPLDLSRLKGYQFFPGQIVALRGSNTTGSSFVVSEVLEIPLLPNAASSPAALAVHRARLATSDDGDVDMDLEGDAKDTKDTKDPPPLNVLFASGPYTVDTNLDFEALHALVSVASDKAVDAVVLSGPFIDADHPMIATGDFDLPHDYMQSEGYNPDESTMTTVFRTMISPALQRLVVANPSVTVLLVPSVRDVINKHVAWPQAPFSRRGLALPQNIKIVGNPVTVSFNEMLMGLSSQDIIYELRHEELAHGRVDEANAVSRACRYLLEQRHFFPLFPPVDRRRLPKTGVEEHEQNGLATGAMLDTKYLTLGEMVNVRPDVMLVPSAMPPFAKVVESVLMINPGYLSKRRGPGTYARMTLYPPPVLAGAEGAEVVGHKIFERARVEITRI